MPKGDDPAFTRAGAPPIPRRPDRGNRDEQEPWFRGLARAPLKKVTLDGPALLTSALDDDGQKRSGFRYQCSSYQIEYSRNLVFQLGGHLDQVLQFRP